MFPICVDPAEGPAHPLMPRPYPHHAPPTPLPSLWCCAVQKRLHLDCVVGVYPPSLTPCVDFISSRPGPKSFLSASPLNVSPPVSFIPVWRSSE